jgi:hypothetical protein
LDWYGRDFFVRTSLAGFVGSSVVVYRLDCRSVRYSCNPFPVCIKPSAASARNVKVSLLFTEFA